MLFERMNDGTMMIRSQVRKPKGMKARVREEGLETTDSSHHLLWRELLAASPVYPSLPGPHAMFSPGRPAHPGTFQSQSCPIKVGDRFYCHPVRHRFKEAPPWTRSAL